MRNSLLLVGIVFAVTLAVIVGNRLSEQAMAVVAGAVCGISASIPVSIVFMLVASRNWGRSEVQDRPVPDSNPDHYPSTWRSQPPVIVISPPHGAFPYPSGTPQYLYSPAEYQPQREREFKIVGDE
jgi:hypothetical protein